MEVGLLLALCKLLVCIVELCCVRDVRYSACVLSTRITSCTWVAFDAVIPKLGAHVIPQRTNLSGHTTPRQALYLMNIVRQDRLEGGSISNKKWGL